MLRFPVTYSAYSMPLRTALTLLLFLAAASPAWSSGSEMAGLAVVVPLLVAGAVVIFAALVWLLYNALPRSWPKAKRLIVALVVSPSAFGVLVLLLSGPGLLQQLLARVLLP